MQENDADRLDKNARLDSVSIKRDVDRLMDEVFYSEGSIRDRLKAIETTLTNTKWFLGVITILLAATLAGVVKLVFTP